MRPSLCAAFDCALSGLAPTPRRTSSQGQVQRFPDLIPRPRPVGLDWGCETQPQIADEQKEDAMAGYKNIEKQKELQLKDLVDYAQGQVVSKTLVQNDAVSMTLFAFDKGEEISTHQSKGDALVTVLDGTGRLTIDGTPHDLSAGQSIVMPANTPHSVYGVERFKMFLQVAF
jgi:quercetin dioxygenase-like cupin family protein